MNIEETAAAHAAPASIPPKTFEPVEADMLACEIEGLGCIVKTKHGVVFIPGACVIDDAGTKRLVSAATGRQEHIRRHVADGGTVTLIGER